jgi:hypothetical protein
MSLLDDFIKNFDKDHYKRYPKARMVVRIFYAASALVILLLIFRAIKMLLWL